MTYFPLISIPVYQDNYSGTFETKNGNVIKNDLHNDKGWKKVESKAFTIAILVISSIIGGALLGIGCSGLCASNFCIHPGICITSILFGVALMVPSVIALKLGFKPDGSREFKPDDITSLSTSSNGTFKVVSGPSASISQPVQANSQVIEMNIKKEKEKYKTLVPKGCYSKFHLSNGNIYYYGWDKVKSKYDRWFDSPNPLYIEIVLSPGESNESIGYRFSGLTFFQG